MTSFSRMSGTREIIADEYLTNNDLNRVIHRFHKRESSIINSIHRFSGFFSAPVGQDLTTRQSGAVMDFGGKRRAQCSAGLSRQGGFDITMRRYV
jgi:hypothetical protein